MLPLVFSCMAYALLLVLVYVYWARITTFREGL